VARKIDDETHFPRYLPPRTVVRLIHADRSTGWHTQIGQIYRIGYYSPNDGLQLVWLVDENGEYSDSCMQHEMPRYFKIERLSDETDFFGLNRRRLGPRARSNRSATNASVRPRRLSAAEDDEQHRQV
jgi:hypothetical protein